MSRGLVGLGACALLVACGGEPSASDAPPADGYPDHWVEPAPARDGGASDAGPGDAGLHVPPRPWVIGHRGIARNSPDNRWPENTVASAEQALEVGADGVEIDVVMTADEEIVLFHDELFQQNAAVRSCDHPEADACCEGNITRAVWDELADCRLYPGDPGGQPRRFATLDELLTLGEMKMLMLDVKNDLFDRQSSDPEGDEHATGRMLEVLAERLRDHGDPPWVVLGLYRDASRAHALELGLQGCLKYHGDEIEWTTEVLLDKVDSVDDWGVCFRDAVFDDPLARGLRERGARSLAYLTQPIGEEAMRRLVERLIAWRVDALLTGEVELALRLRDEVWPSPRVLP